MTKGTRFDRLYRERTRDEIESILIAAENLIHALDYLTFAQRDVCFMEYSRLIDAMNEGLETPPTK